jgi:hypothetical protein
MAELPLPLSTTLSTEQAIEWAIPDVTYAPNVPNEINNVPKALRLVATVMVELEYGLGRYSNSLQAAYRNGYTKPYITQGYHQLETIFSLRLRESVDVMHVTVRLYTSKGTNWDTMHIYVTRDGRLAGATLWNTQLNQPVS